LAHKLHLLLGDVGHFGVVGRAAQPDVALHALHLRAFQPRDELYLRLARMLIQGAQGRRLLNQRDGFAACGMHCAHQQRDELGGHIERLNQHALAWLHAHRVMH
jgi:hypothetical protein